MARRSQPYRLTWPLSAEQLENIDSMFQELFDDLDNGALEIDASQVTAGVFVVTQGGTGLDTLVIGDILYASATDALSRLASVSAGSYLRSAGVATAPVWSTLKLPNAAAQGDIFIVTTADTMTVLAKDANATRYLSNTGTSNNPAWAQVNLANGVTGDLPFANLTQIAGLSVLGVTGNVTADVAAITAGTDNNVLRRSGTTLAFGAINLASTNAVTGDLPFSNLAQGSALSVLGVTGNAIADVASIAAGTDHQVLRRSGTALTFGAVNLAQAAAVTGTLGVTNGGTGLATFAQGDLIYGSAANVLSALAKDANATRYLSNTGASNNPAWAQVNLANGVTGTLPLANGGTGVSDTTQTYTPTLTNVANLDASTAYACQYMRVGNTVIVSGKVDVDPTAPAAATQLGISLPVASALAQQEQLGGAAFASGIAGQGAALRADATNDRAEMVWVSGDITNQPMYFTFVYQVL